MTDLSTNIAKLDGYLDRFRRSGIQNMIGGESRAAMSGKTFETNSPTDKSVICQVAHGSAADIDAAAQAAIDNYENNILCNYFHSFLTRLTLFFTLFVNCCVRDSN